RSCTIVSGCTLCRSRFCRVRIGLDISELIGGYLNKFGISEVLTYALIGGLPRLGGLVDIIRRARHRVAGAQRFSNLELLDHCSPGQRWCSRDEFIVTKRTADRWGFCSFIVGQSVSVEAIDLGEFIGDRTSIQRLGAFIGDGP